MAAAKKDGRQIKMAAIDQAFTRNKILEQV